MEFLKIAGKDIKSIFKNRFIRVSVIAIIVVPLLYSLLYLDAFWDPYAQIEDMTIAVVNEDGGASLDGEKVNYGEDIVANLKNNNKIGWEFTSDKEANEGLENEGYYAKFVIPESFSENIIAAKEGNPEVADLKFVCNEKKNFLAAQINSQVENLLKEEIVSTISNNYVTVAFDKLYEAKDGLVKASDGSGELYDGIGQLNEKVPMLAEGANKLGDGATKLKDGQGTLNSGLKSLNSGLVELKSKVPSLSSGVDKLYAGSEVLKNGLGDAASGSNQLAAGSNGLYSAFSGTVYPAVTSLKSGANELNSKLEAGKGNVNTLKQGGEGLKVASSKVVGADGYQLVKGGVDQLIGGVNASSAAMDDIAKTIMTAAATNPQVASDPNIIAALAKIQELGQATSGTPKQIKELQAGTKAFGDELGKFTGKVNDFATGTIALTDSVANVSAGVSKISGGLNSLEAGLNENTAGSFGNGLKAVSDNMSGLNAGINKLNSGSAEINGGLGELKGNVPALSGGIQALYNGSNQLVDGSNALVDGQNQLSTGVSELTAKVPELQDGVKKLYDGSDELATALEDGATEMKSGLKNSSKVMGDFVSAPINMKNEPINSVPNYGTGFAPYFISLSLWIGAIMMFFVISSKTDDDANLSKFDKVIGKYLSFGFIGLLQAALVSIVVMVLGLSPSSTVMYFTAVIFLSLVFIAIIQCLISLFGDAGRLLGIVLLILQLTACAGTFPLEIVPKFFKVINPYMPFTYSVELLREVISASTINYAIVGKDFLILGIVLLVFLTISVVFKNVGERLQEMIEGRKEESAENINKQSIQG
ncbi:YhgE/Pip domain-containing protein [Clostridium sp.]|uniref:YhgE/Pip domain-containing protein n=1 Tax=Clostridium sp. TaxID=1506 RepID=UPI0032176AB0